ncbi:MAG: hypothetical protein NTX50_10555, partial [Candidatus Sumerlaeota bacterium]|nr:hypothetical protein [Candidatus Sumerlaeota bacterium]
MTACLSFLLSASFFLFQATAATKQSGDARKENGASAKEAASAKANASPKESAPIMVSAKVKPANAWKEYPTRTIHHLPGFDVSKVDGA